MFQVRFHDRGGQGVVTAAELLASAAFREDRYAQAFPNVGSERMGAPVMSFCRIDDKPIRTREPVTEPDALLIQDPTLFPVFEAEAGEVVSATPIRRQVPVIDYLRLQARYAHLFRPEERTDVIARIQASADRNVSRFGLLQDYPERTRLPLDSPVGSAEGR